MITVQIEYDDAEKPDIDENWVRSICENIFVDSKGNKTSITIIFSNDYKLREGDPIEGEVYISLERVSENAHIFKQDFITECKRIIIHGCLHLLGHNDESAEDKIKMIQLEEKYLSHNIKVN